MNVVLINNVLILWSFCNDNNKNKCNILLKRAETGVIPSFQGFSHAHAQFVLFSLYGTGTTR